MQKRQGAFQSNVMNTVNIKCRVFITDEKLLNEHFGHCRYIFNWAIDHNKERYRNGEKSLSAFSLAKLLPQLKKNKDTAFLGDVDSTCLQQALQDYWTAMQGAFSKKGGWPHYKTKHGEQSFRIMNVCNRIRFNNNGDKLKLGKFGWVRTKPNQSIPKGSIQSVTIKRNKWGKVFATLTIRREEPIAQLPKTGKEVGIDIGMKNFASLSDGSIIERPSFIERDEARKKSMQRRLSKMKKGGKNYRKMQMKYAKFCQKDKNRREDFAHKWALEIVRNYDFIAVEKLNIQQMLMSKGTTFAVKKIHKLIGELGWNSFLSKLEYKAQWYGKELVKVDTFYPSSQLCSSCGYKNSDVKNLAIRNWTCPQCGTHHDRDFNAATNILKKGKEMAVA